MMVGVGDVNVSVCACMSCVCVGVGVGVGVRCEFFRDLFEFNTCVWIIKKLFLFRFVVGGWRS